MIADTVHLGKLNLGSGRHTLTGFTGVDLHEADVNIDLGRFPWPWPDRSVDEIVASHILEHFPKVTGLGFLVQCRRVLVPGGVLHLAVPDMDRFILARQSGDWGLLDGYAWTDLNNLLGGDETEPPEMRHRYMYCFESLAWTLQVAGFRSIVQRAKGPLDNPKYEPISLYVDAER